MMRQTTFTDMFRWTKGEDIGYAPTDAHVCAYKAICMLLPHDKLGPVVDMMTHEETDAVLNAIAQSVNVYLEAR